MTGRGGNSNAAQKLADATLPEWTKWATKTLHGRCIKFIESQCRARKGHTFGELIRLATWQKEWLEEVLSGEVISSSVLSLGRGNGKTTFAGGVATWALFDPAVAEVFGGQPIIPVVAPTLNQAVGGVYGDAIGFIKGNPELRDRCLIYASNGNQKVLVPYNYDGSLFPLAANTEHLQGLDPMMALVDEVGFIAVDVWDALLLASGKRPRNLVLGLGTKSPGESDNALDHLIRQVATYGELPGFKLVTYEAPERCAIDDREAWRAANPALAEGYLSEDEIARGLKQSPEPLFRCFRLNQKVASVDGWLGVDGAAHWDATKSTTRELLPTEPIYIGVDKSARGDLSAVVAIQPMPDKPDHWFAKAQVFYPEGNAINHKAVRDYLRQLNDSYDVLAIGYDPRYFVEGAQELLDEGLPMIEVPQTQQRMSPAYATLYQLIVSHRFWHEDDLVYRNHILGAAAKDNQTGGFMLHKGKSGTHIDAAAASAIAVHTAGIEVPVYRPEHFWVV